MPEGCGTAGAPGSTGLSMRTESSSLPSSSVREAPPGLAVLTAWIAVGLAAAGCARDAATSESDPARPACGAGAGLAAQRSGRPSSRQDAARTPAALTATG